MIGVSDRRTKAFENLWPLDNGVTYNSYLIADEKSALLDTVQLGSEGAYIERVESLLEGKPLDYLVINHMEPDHSGEIEAVLMRWPGVRIVGNSQTRKILEKYYSFPASDFMEVADGDTLELGKHTLKFYLTPWVHWPETMMTYETAEQMLFSGDAFGTFGTTDGNDMDTDDLLDRFVDEMRRYYSNIIGKYSGMVQKALAKTSGLAIKTICPLHGPVWRKHVKDVLALYDKWSKWGADDAVVVIYGSMYNNTAGMADYVARKMAEKGVTDIKVYDSSKTNLSYLISEMWRCKYIVLASCSYNGGMFPLVDNVCRTMLSLSLKNRSLAIFGTGSWGGGAVRTLKMFADDSGWEQVCEPVEIFGRATPERMGQLDVLAEAVAGRIVK